MEAWPSSLPQSVLVDYEIEPRCGLTDEKETRNSERNRTYPERDATFQMVMTAAQVQTFRSWWDGTLNQCAPFTAPWLEGLGYSFHFLRFREDPSWSNMGVGYWTVTLPVEIIAGVETTAEGDPVVYVPEEAEGAPYLCLSFDGDDYVSIPNIPDYDFGANQDFSYVVVFQTDDTTRCDLLENGNGSLETDGRWSCLYIYDSCFKASIDDGTNAVWAGSGCVVNDGSTHVGIATYDRDGNCLVYVDGDLKATWDISSVGDITNSNYGVSLGRRSGGKPEDWFEGKLFFIGIYNRVLTPSEVASFDRENPPTSGLIGRFDVSDSSGTTLTDSSGNDNDGTIVGATWEEA
jgi:hypothetical protein